MTREWFTTYCQNAAANVLDKDGNVRFTYEQLSSSLAAASNHSIKEIPSAVLNLCDNIVKLCDARCAKQMKGDNDEWVLILTLLNIHAAYLMISGLWKDEPPAQSDVDEYGFEIF